MKTFKFISHSWAYSDAYEKLVNLLDARAYFSYRNTRFPKTMYGTDCQTTP